MVSNIFYFHPYLGKWSNLTNIFQLGWNHQLEKDDFPASYVGFSQRVFPSHQLESIPPGQWSLCIPSLCWKSKELSKCKKTFGWVAFFKLYNFQVVECHLLYIYIQWHIYIYIFFRDMHIMGVAKFEPSIIGYMFSIVWLVSLDVLELHTPAL